jgi:hypothetical protein
MGNPYKKERRMKVNKSTMRGPDGHGFITHTAGRKNTPADEIERIINKIDCCTLKQMLDYLEMEGTTLTSLFQFCRNMQLAGKIKMLAYDDMAETLIYSARYQSIDELGSARVYCGICRMAVILPFLPYSKEIIQAPPPLDFMFCYQHSIMQVAIISKGHEYLVCNMLDTMPLTKQADPSQIVRIAIVDNAECANKIAGGGISYACCLDNEKKLQIIKRISYRDAWGCR